MNDAVSNNNMGNFFLSRAENPDLFPNIDGAPSVANPANFSSGNPK